MRFEYTLFPLPFLQGAALETAAMTSVMWMLIYVLLAAT